MNVKPNSFGLTHVGMRRSHNEDSIFLFDDIGLYIVADGMGGHAMGEVASALAVKTISEELFSSNQSNSNFSLVKAVKQANSRIYQYSRERLESVGGSGTLMAGGGGTAGFFFCS